MSLPITYSYPAVFCPAVPVSGTLLDPYGIAAAPVGWEDIVSGAVSGSGAEGLARLRRNFMRGENAGRYGGGAYAVAEGLLPLSATGLVQPFSAGAAMIDTVVIPQTLTVTLPDNSPSLYLWLLQSGAITAYTTSAIPNTAAAYLMRATTAAGAVTRWDFSGRVELRGGGLYRRTGDTTAPADAPSGRLQILTETAEGFYLWTGTEYVSLDAAASTASQLARLAALESDRDALQTAFRRLLHHYAAALGEVPPGLEAEFALSDAALP